MMRCLLDMDGVLVDFVGGACRFHGVPNPYDDKANHGRYHVEDLIGMSKPSFFAPLGEQFWTDLDPTPECFDIVKLLERTFTPEGVCIMTSPILTSGCAEGKIRWIRRHLPQYSRRFLIGPTKEFAASSDAWLVDDSDRNIDRFREWGGKGVLVPRPWNTAHALSGIVMASLNVDLPEPICRPQGGV